MRCNFTVYVEGGFHREKNIGAFAYIIIDGITGEEYCHYSEQIKDTNSARVHFDGLVSALKALPPNTTALVICDANYLTNVMSGLWRAKANLDIIARAHNIMRTRNIQCFFQWKSIKLKDPLMKRVWRMCSNEANLDFEQMFEERKK